MNTSTVPALFLSHGSPMFALDPGQTGPALRAFGEQLQKNHPGLKGVVVMSPHWMTRGLGVMTAARPETWHDFGGFPEPLYRLQYPAPGSLELAQQVLELLRQAGAPAQPDPERPFDHGAWVPLMHLLPKADVPVVQVSLPANLGPRELYVMGAALRPLREQGVLVVGSGSMTHNLREFAGGRPAQDAPASPYVETFSRWVEDTLTSNDLERLFDFENQAPNAARAHPTDEHFLTIFFALGAAGWGEPNASKPQYLTREVMYSYLAMDSFVLQ